MISLIRSLFIPYSCRHRQICTCHLVLCDRGGYPAMRLNADDAITRLAFVKVGGRVNKRGRAAHGVSRAEVLIRSAIPSGSNSVAIICKWGRHITTHTEQNFFNPKVMSITHILNTLIESQFIKWNTDSLFHFVLDYERKYIYNAIWNMISVTTNIYLGSHVIL